jgi:hypothetical protein
MLVRSKKRKKDRKEKEKEKIARGYYTKHPYIS